MPISNSDQLFRLVKSLTKSEKRNFKLYVRRIQKGEETIRFLELFEVLEKQDVYEEQDALEKLKEKSKSKFANLRRHLYQHLLTSLRLVNLNKEIEIQIREEIDYAHILYGKGFYLEALKLLDRAKKMAKSNNLDLLHLASIEFEKKIESRHITRSSTERIEELLQEAAGRNKILSNIISLSNLKLLLQRHFINQGHVKNEQEKALISSRHQALLPDKKENGSSFFEQIYLFESLYWHHYILLEMESCYQYAASWVKLYQDRPHMIEEDVDMYMRGMHHLLTACWFIRQTTIFDQTLQDLHQFVQQNQERLNPNSQTLARLYITQWQINQYFIKGKFASGLGYVAETLKVIKQLEERLDSHKILILYYKIAGLYLGAGQPAEAITYLYEIINLRAGYLREDIQCYARLLLIMAHYEMENFDLLESLVRSTQRFMKKMPDRSSLQEVMLKFFKNRLKNPLEKEQADWTRLIRDLEKLKASPFEQRSFLYLDAMNWAQSTRQKR